MGQPTEVSESGQRYSYALGMDWACGLGALATRFETPFTIGTGPIQSIEQFTAEDGTRYLCVLSGHQLWVSPATDGNINALGDFRLERDFGSPATPPAPRRVTGGATGPDTWSYRLGVSGHGATGVATSPPQSPAGAILTITNAPSPINAGNPVNLEWDPAPNGLGITVYRSSDGTTWASRYAGLNATTLTDDGSGWGIPAPLTLAVAGQEPYQLLASANVGVSSLWVGMEAGAFWGWDGSAWHQTLLPGRVLAAEGGQFLRTAPFATVNPDGFQNTVYQSGLDITAVSAAWTTVYSDERSFEITRLVRLQGHLFVFEEGRIALAGSTAAALLDLTPDRGLPPNPNNGRTACVWLGSVYAPFGMGLYKITPGGAGASIEAVGLERLIENDAPVQGRITALAPWGPWHLFWASYNEREGTGGTAYLGKYGAWVNPEAVRDPNSQLIPVLHGALEAWPGRQITWMQHSTIGEPSGNGRLYVGFDNGDLTWTILPGQTPFAPNDPVCRFRSSGYTVLSRHSMGFQADDKNYFDVTAYGTVLSNHQRVTFDYQLAGDTDWRSIPGDVSSGGEPLVFPEGATAKWIQLRVTMETDDPADSPVIEGIALGEQLRPSSIEEIAFTAHVGPRLVRRDGHVTRASAKELHDLLRRLEAKGDDVRVLLPDGQEERAAINDFTDRYLEGSTTMGPRHDMSLTLLTFKTVS